MENINNKPIYLWALVALCPLLMILYAFIFGQWTWGLMEDHAIVAGLGKSIFFNIGDYITGWLQCGRGLKYTYILYSHIFYFIFKDSPNAFYLCHAIFFFLTFMIWGFVAYLCTQELLSLVLVPAITLSCTPLYEGFFYLCVEEIFVLFLLGTALIFLIKIFDAKGKDQKISPFNIIAVLISLFFLFGSKETFVAPLLVVSAIFIIRAFSMRWRMMVLWITGVMILTFIYIIWLKFFIQGGYTSSYSFSDIPHLITNIEAWGHDVFLGHIPWLLLTVFLLWRYKVDSLNAFKKNFQIIYLGIGLYFSYLIIILPWRGMSYMAIPLAVFFAFTITVLIVHGLKRVMVKYQILLAGILLIFNMVPAYSQLTSFAQYNRDTIGLLEWINNDPFLWMTIGADKHLGCNAFEPALAIPHLVKIIDKKDFPSVSYTPIVRDIISDREMYFYFYLTRYGDQDLSRLGNMWTEVFVTPSWIVFRRNFY